MDLPHHSAAPGPIRLSPQMASLRLLVLDFVRAYIRRWGGSPSYGEISAGAGAPRSTVKRAVLSLVDEGLLLRTPGTRGLALPSLRDDAIRRLRELGFVVDEDVLRVGLPEHGPKRALLPPAVLDYVPSAEDGIDGEDEAHASRAA